MILTDAYIYRNSINNKLTNKEILYEFIMQLGLFLEQYYINTNIIKILYDNFTKKKIILYIITRNNGVKKIIIFPGKYVIQTNENVYKYVKNNKNVKNTFSFIFLNLIEKYIIDIHNILSINVNTNIKRLENHKLGY
jgi:hypothetical protein